MPRNDILMKKVLTKVIDTVHKLAYTNFIKEMKIIINKRKKMSRMPLTMAGVGEQNVIKRVGGKEEIKKFLENLGFVVGSTVTVISQIGGNVIVNVKDSRVAIGKDMANKILV